MTKLIADLTRLNPSFSFEEVMAEFDTPEILRTSFSRLFLRAKKLSEVGSSRQSL